MTGASQVLMEVEDLVWGQGPLRLGPFRFRLNPGELLIVAGNSGCGKSSLLSVLTGLRRPSRGRVLLGGRDIWAMGEVDRIQYVAEMCAMMFQHGALLGSLTLLENVAFPAESRWTRAQRPLLALAQEKLRKVGLDLVCDLQYPGKSSGGQRKRASLARALLLGRPILFCDEPTAGLHPSASGGADRLLRRVGEEGGRGVVVVTHDPDTIRAIGTMMLVMRRDENRTRQIYFGPAQRRWPPDVEDILNRHGEDIG